MSNGFFLEVGLEQVGKLVDHFNVVRFVIWRFLIDFDVLQTVD